MGCFRCCCCKDDRAAIEAKTSPRAEAAVTAPASQQSMGAVSNKSRFENKAPPPEGKGLTPHRPTENKNSEHTETTRDTTAARQYRTEELRSSEDDQSADSTKRLNEHANADYGSADSVEERNLPIRTVSRQTEATFIAAQHSNASLDNHQGKAGTKLPVKDSYEAPKFEDHVREQALLQGFTKEASEALLADLPTEIKFLEVVPSSHQAKLLELELKSAKQKAEQKAKNIIASREMIANDPFLAMIRDIAVEQGYSKGALAVLMSDLPESMLDVKALPAKHHRLALDAEVKEAREAAESKAALNS